MQIVNHNLSQIVVTKTLHPIREVIIFAIGYGNVG